MTDLAVVASRHATRQPSIWRWPPRYSALMLATLLLLGDCQLSRDSWPPLVAVERIALARRVLEPANIFVAFSQNIEHARHFPPDGPGSADRYIAEGPITYLWMSDSYSGIGRHQEIRLDVDTVSCVRPSEFSRAVTKKSEKSTEMIHVLDGRGGYVRWQYSGQAFTFRDKIGSSSIIFREKEGAEDDCATQFTISKLLSDES